MAREQLIQKRRERKKEVYKYLQKFEETFKNPLDNISSETQWTMVLTSLSLFQFKKEYHDYAKTVILKNILIQLPIHSGI